MLGRLGSHSSLGLGLFPGPNLLLVLGSVSSLARFQGYIFKIWVTEKAGDVTCHTLKPNNSAHSNDKLYSYTFGFVEEVHLVSGWSVEKFTLNRMVPYLSLTCATTWVASCCWNQQACRACHCWFVWSLLPRLLHGPMEDGGLDFFQSPDDLMKGLYLWDYLMWFLSGHLNLEFLEKNWGALIKNQTFRMEKQLGQVTKSPSTWVAEEEDKILQICRIYVEVGECLVPLVMTQCTDAQIVSILEVPPTQQILRPQNTLEMHSLLGGFIIPVSI